MSRVYLRASIGTLAALGLLEDFKISEYPYTAYLLQYSEQGCSGKCLFCLQSRTMHDKYKGLRLGRVSWPVIELGKLCEVWKGVFKRTCFQTIIKPFFHVEALEILKTLRDVDPNTPLSLAVTPVSIDVLKKARDIGVDALGVGLDAFTANLFYKWNKPYSWSTYLKFIEKSLVVFGPGNVYVHLVAGLGETVQEAVEFMKYIHKIGGRIALFNYVNERGRSTIKIEDYRLLQLARYLIESGLNPDNYVDYTKRRVVKSVDEVDIMEAFYTSGCPHCNRPFYNESPGSAMYNLPSKRMLRNYVDKLREELARIGVAI